MEKIFSTYKIGSKTAKNRIIRSATNDHLGNFDGSVSDAEIEMYDSLARNDVGTIITGHMSVAPDLGLRADEVQLSIGNDKYVDGLRMNCSNYMMGTKLLDLFHSSKCWTTTALLCCLSCEE